MNHIVFCINDNWSIPASVLIQSIIHYNENCDFTFHVISKNLSEKSLSSFNILAKKNPLITINTIIIKENELSNLPIRQNDHVTIETYYRFLIPELLDKSISKILYLDCDILCTGNIDDLFKIDITDYACAMCPDTRFSDIEIYNRLDYPYENGYFCAGVILLNLDFWRKNKTADKCIEFLSENGNLCLWHDQDAINKILNGNILYLHPKYDLLTGFYYEKLYKTLQYSNKNKYNLIMKKELWNDLEEAMSCPILIHFTGKVKPWHNSYYIKPFTQLWRLFYKECNWIKYKLQKSPEAKLQKTKILIKALLRKTSRRRYSKEIYDVELKLINEYYNNKHKE